MKSYWDSGFEGVSVNEICRRGKVSKPGLYREFGNEDGLISAALALYFEQILSPLLTLAESDLALCEKLNNIVSVMTADRDEQGLPHGCLLLKMAHAAPRLGSRTRQQIEACHSHMLDAYKVMLSGAKARDELPEDMSVDFAATYIDAQLTNAMSMQARGEQADVIRQILALAFSSFE